MSFESMREQLVPGAFIVTRKDRISKLYDDWSPDVIDVINVAMTAPVKLEPRTVCTLIARSKRQPYDWFYVLANGTTGWLTYWDIAHVEHVEKVL